MILITGSGLLGAYVTKHLALDSYNQIILLDIAPDMDYIKSIIKKNINKIKVIKGSILDEVLVEKVISEYKIDTIIHTVALIPINGAHYNDSMININIMGTEILLKKAVAKDVKKFIFISSVAVYNYSKDIPSCDVCEEFSTELREKTIYGASKVFCENLGRYYRNQYGIEFISVRLCGVYGPSPKNYYGNKLLWRTIFDKAILEKTIDLNKEQLPRDQYLFVDDAAIGISQLIKSKTLNYDVYNMGSKFMYSMQDFIDSAKNTIKGLKVIGENVNINGYKYGLDFKKANKDFNYDPIITLGEGFDIYYRYLTQDI